MCTMCSMCSMSSMSSNVDQDRSTKKGRTTKKRKARTALGSGVKKLLCDPRSELRLGERQKRRAKILLNKCYGKNEIKKNIQNYVWTWAEDTLLIVVPFLPLIFSFSRLSSCRTFCPDSGTVLLLGQQLRQHLPILPRRLQQIATAPLRLSNIISDITRNYYRIFLNHALGRMAFVLPWPELQHWSPKNISKKRLQYKILILMS